MSVNGSSKLEALEQKKAALEMKLSNLRKAASAAARRDDSRRKLLIGAAVLSAIGSGRLSQDSVIKMLDRFLTRPSDRAAFSDGRLALPPASASPSEGESA